jgi:hypothetical protein
MQDERRTPDEIEIINNVAGEFSRILKEWIGTINLTEVNRRNRKKEYKGCCASHDFCDANMAMLEAFEDITGEDCNLEDPYTHSIMNEAWDCARIADFNHSER